MTKGMTSFGQYHNKMHTLCHRCGSKACHLQTSICDICGYPTKCKKKYNWSVKAKRQNTAGTKKKKKKKITHHNFRHEFCEGTAPTPKRAAVPGFSLS
ncbi:large ribosomal subunit protein eL37-like [Callospermophilus lateralis]|uniref:large ribosomal subunit protein eL37-like n=1 Tax=Callospermophilus lateralis TaxID=76772 RepID=UPI004053A9AC